MKIRDRLIENAQGAAAEAQKQAQILRNKDGSVQSDGTRTNDEQRVELSVAKTILALENSTSISSMNTRMILKASSSQFHCF